MRKKLLATVRGLVAVVLMLFATNFLPVLSAMQPHAAADPDPKVFVCKYVGKPGVDERLQTGTNPISVSSSSTGGTAVGSYFSDAQGRSYVLAIDNTAPGPAGDPDVSACPAPQGPTVIAPPTLHTDVVCGPSNDVTTLVDSSDSAHYTVSHVGNTYTVTANSGYTFATGTSVTLTVPADANTTCPDVVITPPTLHTDVVCGPNNDVTTLVDSSDSAHYTVVHTGDTYTVTAKDGYTFSAGKTVTLTVPADDNTACPDQTITPPTLSTQVVCGPDNDITTLVDSSDSVHYTVSQNGNTYTVTAKTGYTFATGKTVTLTVPADDNTACPDTVITPPTLSTQVVCGRDNDVTTLVDSSDSNHYTVSHQGDTYTVTADNGFTFATGKVVTLTAPADANTVCPPTDMCPNVPGVQTSADDCGSVQGATDVCPNLTGDQLTVPTGMTKDQTTGNCVTTPIGGGQGGGGEVLGASTTAPQLVNTGESPVVNLIVGITAIMLTLTLTLVSRRQYRLDS